VREAIETLLRRDGRWPEVLAAFGADGSEPMRRIAAFVVLAGGGLAAIAATSGGFSAPPAAAEARARRHGRRAGRLARRAWRDAAAPRPRALPPSVEPLEALDVHENPPRTWVDPVTKEKVEPYYPELSVHFSHPAPFSDAASATSARGGARPRS
jgi:hypothetical protein